MDFRHFLENHFSSFLAGMVSPERRYDHLSRAIFADFAQEQGHAIGDLFRLAHRFNQTKSPEDRSRFGDALAREIGHFQDQGGQIDTYHIRVTVPVAPFSELQYYLGHDAIYRARDNAGWIKTDPARLSPLAQEGILLLMLQRQLVAHDGWPRGTQGDEASSDLGAHLHHLSRAISDFTHSPTYATRLRVRRRVDYLANQSLGLMKRGALVGGKDRDPLARNSIRNDIQHLLADRLLPPNDPLRTTCGEILSALDQQEQSQPPESARGRGLPPPRVG